MPLLKVLRRLGAALLLIFLIGCMCLDIGRPGSERNQLSAKELDHTWIVRWRGEPPPSFMEESSIRTTYPHTHVTVARPHHPIKMSDWLERWGNHPDVLSIEPNQKVRISKAPNDPLLSKQSYLQQIHADEAWDTATDGSSLIVAVVDTGVDLQHPDLKDNLTEGINLIQPGTLPNDDNGHGTNVAGVIAAMADNDAGTAGLLWNARIMPIKALEADGNGDEDRLGEGIRYAVDHGAKVVVLSLGLNKYSAYMQNVVHYAEEKGVLLVAASGNEGNAVKYPAAYETVLAIGGVDGGNQPERLSNSGPELDLVAPWVVFTTAMGGGYESKDGTSMAAPQAAAVATLAWGSKPDLTPAQVRNLLRQTAQDLGSKGWDSRTGYGLLRADRVLQEAPKPDIYEPNNRQALAAPVPVNKRLKAELTVGDEDWYIWETPYDGSVDVHVTGPSAGSLLLTLISETTRKEQTVEAVLNADNATPFDLKKGKYYVKVASPGLNASLAYDMSVHFRIYQDLFEDNDRQFKAFMLPTRSQMVIGTLHQQQDQDWFSIQIDQPGSLRLKVSPDTARMDLVLQLQRKGEQALTVDRAGDGKPESTEMSVKPGLYYMKVSNISNYMFPVTGEYVLDFDLVTSYEDPYEPNDKSYQAMSLTFGESYYGMVHSASDSDWFRFQLTGESLVELGLDPAPNRSGLSMQVFDHSLKNLQLVTVREDFDRLSGSVTLPEGTYYVKLASTGDAQQLFYGLKASATPVVQGFTDLYDHWAEKEIVTLITSGHVEGYGSSLLRPDSPISRAEAVTLLDRMLNLPTAPPPPYRDVPDGHWAYNAVARAAKAGIVNGYEDLIFAPDRNISRMEMAVLLANVTGRKGITQNEKPFTDVESSYWGASVLHQLKAEGWAAGYDDGNYRPEQIATRAEFMSLVVRMLGL